MSKVRILIVEDQMITATDIQGILIRFDYEVVGIVSSGKEAIEKAAKGKTDLVLMDIVLKGPMDGIEA
ncbi:MAG: response regulator, partial [Desulfobulbaceae bacterium]|nr:response regulator [Desulfobulbaceae bacterium]